MALPTNVSQRELDKFASTSNGVAVKVVNPDGSNISGGGGSNATVAVASAATLFAVVNTQAAGQASVVLDTGTKFIGLATVVIGSGGGTSTVFQGGSWSVGISTAMVTVTLGAGLNAIDDTVSFGDGLISGLKLTVASTATGNPAMVALMDRAGHAASINTSGQLLTAPTLQTGSAFIGLATVVIGSTILPDTLGMTFASPASIAISLASLANGSGRQGALISNPSGYPAAMIDVSFWSGNGVSTDGAVCELYLIRSGASMRDDNAGTTDAAWTPRNAGLIGSLVFASTSSTSWAQTFDTAPLGPLGQEWTLGVRNSVGTNLGATENAFVKNFRYYTSQWYRR